MAKAGDTLSGDAPIAVRGQDHPWVSRGGLKLAHGLAAFGLSPAGRVCLDVGASTGGFTDVLLAAGAAKVYAVDVGHGQLAWKLRTDPRVVALERTNARYLTAAEIPEPITALSCDASFIGLATLLPAPLALCLPGAWAIALIKPQFEAGPAEVGQQRRRPRPRGPAGGLPPCFRLVGRSARLGGARAYREPDHRAGRQPRVPARRCLPLMVRQDRGRGSVWARQFGQQRPDATRLHRHIWVVQQPVKLVELARIVSLRHRSPSSHVPLDQAEQ